MLKSAELTLLCSMKQFRFDVARVKTSVCHSYYTDDVKDGSGQQVQLVGWLSKV